MRRIRRSKRRILTKKANRRNFRKYSRKTHRKNLIRTVPFGGYRL